MRKVCMKWLDYGCRGDDEKEKGSNVTFKGICLELYLRPLQGSLFRSKTSKALKPSNERPELVTYALRDFQFRPLLQG